MSTDALRTQLGEIARLGLGVPLLLITLLAMVILPLPAFMLDALFTFNIALSLIIILAVIYITRPLDFAVFPTVLLAVTLLRLALNVASTRVVLLEGHTGPGAAGRVIEAFGHFVVGGNYAVGIVVFAILVIINFAVVTKGAGRVSEVTARFTLDAMPGKQMAIDADLNAGIIDQQEAIRRRTEVREEADFYGAMDGASKFVRGDALAGVLILVINVLGGLLIGTLGHGLSFAEAGRVYTLLTIGDGLVAQIPALLLSTAVAIIVTRVSRPQALTDQVLGQVFLKPQSLTIAGAALGIMGLLPGMPNLPFLATAGIALYAGRQLQRRRAGATTAELAPAETSPPAAAETAELSWNDLAPVDPIGLEVGYRLIPLVDRHQDGPLLKRIKGVRRKLSEDLGFLIQPVHIRDNLEIRPGGYRILFSGVPVGEGEIQPDRELAINPGRSLGALSGARTTDPAFGLEAYWIEPGARDHAQTLGYTVVDASTVMATHLSELLKRHAHKLLGHQEVQHLLDRLAVNAPKLVENLTPAALPMGIIVRVMQELLAEQVSVRDARSIAEALAEHAPRTQDAGVLVASVREALGHAIVQGIYGLRDELPVIVLDPALEQLLQENLQQSSREGASLEPALANRLQTALIEVTRRQEAVGDPAVLVTTRGLRAWLARWTRFGVPGLRVLAYSEIPQDKSMRIVASVGGRDG